MIIQAQENYYAVLVDKSLPVVQVEEHSILAWNIRELDAVGNLSNPEAITIFGRVVPEFIAHPTGIYTEVATGIQYKDKFWFVQCLQAVLDDERAKGNV